MYEELKCKKIKCSWPRACVDIINVLTCFVILHVITGSVLVIEEYSKLAASPTYWIVINMKWEVNCYF